jgi:hypothetical protein
VTDLVLGITGSRHGITDAQRIALRELIDSADAIHHGACVGADEESHDIAQLLGKRIYIHPPINEKWMMPREKWLDEHVVYGAVEYHERNRSIVNLCQTLLALPDGPKRLRSGTWSTVRYAHDMKVETIICYPDGKTSHA